MLFNIEHKLTMMPLRITSSNIIHNVRLIYIRGIRKPKHKKPNVMKTDLTEVVRIYNNVYASPTTTQKWTSLYDNVRNNTFVFHVYNYPIILILYNMYEFFVSPPLSSYTKTMRRTQKKKSVSNIQNAGMNIPSPTNTHTHTHTQKRNLLSYCNAFELHIYNLKNPNKLL